MTDAHLLSGALAGDAASFAALYDRHGDAVFGYALRLLRDRNAAEDLVQDVFLTLLRKGGTYDAARPFKTWLLTLVRNASIDTMRSAHRRMEKSAERGMLETAAAPSADGALPEALDRALAELPDAYREAVWLCDAMEMSYAEAAGVMGCDTDTVGSRIARGRRMLREHFARNGHAM